MGSLHNDLHSWAAKARRDGNDTIVLDVETAERIVSALQTSTDALSMAGGIFRDLGWHNRSKVTTAALLALAPCDYEGPCGWKGSSPLDDADYIRSHHTELRRIAFKAHIGGANMNHEPVAYRGYQIRFDPPPIPTRAFDWAWVHDDYDGAPDGNDFRYGASASLEQAKADIDEQISETE